MVAIKAHFDGTHIEVPPELRNAKPGEVVIMVAETMLEAPPARPSIWDVINRATGTRSAEDILRQVDRDRDEWDR